MTAVRGFVLLIFFSRIEKKLPFLGSSFLLTVHLLHARRNSAWLAIWRPSI